MGQNLRLDASLPVAKRAGAGGAWFLPGALAVSTALLMALLAGSVRIPGPSGVAPKSVDSVPRLTVTRLDRLPLGGEVREQLRLWDPARLFLPAPHLAESTIEAEVEVDRPGGSVTERFPAALIYRDNDPAKEMLRPSPPRTPLAAIEHAAGGRWFAGMSRDDSPSGDKTAAEGPRLEVYPVGQASSSASIELPKLPEVFDAAWTPIELSVIISSTGAVTTPALISGSGVGELDERIRSVVARELLPRLRLRPGAYRLVVGP